MTCPKCDRGVLVQVTRKGEGDVSTLCPVCGTIWLVGEDIHMGTGHPFDLFSRGGTTDYLLLPGEDKDQEHRSVEYPLYK